MITRSHGPDPRDLGGAKILRSVPQSSPSCAASEVELIIEEPSMVVEVTSPSTRATDRREKLDAYMRMPSLRMYLIVEQRRHQVLVYSRADAPGWIRDEILNAGDIPLPFLDGSLSIDEIYDDVPLPPLTVREDDGDDLDDWDVDETE